MKEWHYTITESMLTELKLRGTELNLFAILNGYSQKGDGCFYGSRSELAHRCGVTSLRTIDGAIKSLIDKQFIERFNVMKDGRPITAYGLGAKFAQEGAKIARVGVQNLHITEQNLHGGCAKIAHKNIERKKEVSSIPPSSPLIDKPKPSSFTPPTLQEVTDYARERGFADPAGFADFFLTICTNNGWRRGEGQGKPITNWKNYIVSCWERNRKTEIFTQQPQQKGATRIVPMDPSTFESLIP